MFSEYWWKHSCIGIYGSICYWKLWTSFTNHSSLLHTIFSQTQVSENADDNRHHIFKHFLLLYNEFGWHFCSTPKKSFVKVKHGEGWLSKTELRFQIFKTEKAILNWHKRVAKFSFLSDKKPTTWWFAKRTQLQRRQTWVHCAEAKRCNASQNTFVPFHFFDKFIYFYKPFFSNFHSLDS